MVSSSFGWCYVSPLLLVVLPFFSSFGWGCVLPLFCWVVLLGFFLFLGGVAWFPFSFLLVLLHFSPSSGWCCCVSYPVWWCLPFFTSCGVVVLHLFCLVVLLGFLLLLWVVLRFVALSFCVVRPSFVSFGWGCVSPLFCWVALLGLLFFWEVLRLSSPFCVVLPGQHMGPSHTSSSRRRPNIRHTCGEFERCDRRVAMRAQRCWDTSGNLVCPSTTFDTLNSNGFAGLPDPTGEDVVYKFVLVLQCALASSLLL